MRLLPAHYGIALACVMCALPAATAHAQRTTVLTGRVTDAASNARVVGAQIVISGSSAGAITNSNGVYVLRGLAAGAVTVRALSIGYAEQSQTVTLREGESVTADFALQAVAIDVSPVVATATGQQRKVELGNNISHVNAARATETRPIANIGDLLTSQAAGVSVTPGVQAGAGIRVRIRGNSSLSLSNNPIWIIDGIRIEGGTGSTSISVGGTSPSRIGDINAEEIASLEVIRGPSAATLYGTDAANGVIVITTKRGVAGKARWTYYTEQAAVTDHNHYPTAYRGWRTGPTPATNSTASNNVQCFLTQVASGACVQDSVTSYNLTKDPDATPYGTGYRQQHGLQVGGGTDAFRYFLHAEYENEDGMTKVPEFEKRYMAAHDMKLSAAQSNPNNLNRITVRGNFDIAVRDNLNVALNTGFIDEKIRFPFSDDSGTRGIAANTYGGPGFKYNLNPRGDTLYGWREYTPRDIYEAENNQLVSRSISSITGNWRPRDWLSMHGNVGLDFLSRRDTQLCRFGDCTNSLDRLGYKIDNRGNLFVYTLNMGATGVHRLKAGAELQTALGFQYFQSTWSRNGSEGDVLPPGATTVTAAAVKNADEATIATRTLGTYMEERLALRDRLFLTGAVRSDRNSAFGANFHRVFYPKVSASWIISQEPLFPRFGWLTQLRLRSAYGASGVQPGNNDALPYFLATQVLGESGEVAGVAYATFGNTHLKPERSTEFEGGFDLSLLRERISAELTYYQKNSKDALLFRPLAPSLGIGLAGRFENLGHVRNAGLEAHLSLLLVQRPWFRWDMDWNGDINHSTVVSMGGLPPFKPAPWAEVREGYPPNALWSPRLISYRDKNGNGIIEYNADPDLSEIVAGDTAEFHGTTSPTREVAVTNTLDFWHRRVRLSGLVDYKGGHMIYNNTERARCNVRYNCVGLIDKAHATLFEQARTVMLREDSTRSMAGFFEKGDFLRFRELSISFVPDATWLKGLKSRNLILTLAARNVAMLWRAYAGVDPEGFSTAGDMPSEFQAFGPPTYFSLRLTMGF